MASKRPTSPSRATGDKKRKVSTKTIPLRTQIFISYAHEDDEWRRRLVTNLKTLVRKRLVEVWDDTKIGAGENWLEKIDSKMLGARIAVLLISEDFLASDFIFKKEVPRLFNRHKRAGMTIFPLLIRSCDWEEVSWLRRKQIRPKDGNAMAKYKGDKRSEELAKVVKEVAKIARSSRS
jgi:hypothetical protein